MESRCTERSVGRGIRRCGCLQLVGGVVHCMALHGASSHGPARGACCLVRHSSGERPMMHQVQHLKALELSHNGPFCRVWQADMGAVCGEATTKHMAS